MPISDFRFSHKLRVRYSEVDPQAVVFHARYLDYADVAITEYWRTFGLSIVSAEGNPEFQLVQASISYKQPLRVDEEALLFVRTSRIGRSSLTTVVEIHGVNGEDLRAAIEETHVNVDLSASRSAPIPEWLVAKIESYEAKPLRS